jgi:protein tyrosine phosphatase (PTP) superfamily phosphohydrolase (DUF442 family)
MSTDFLNPPDIQWVIPQRLARSSRPGNPSDDVQPKEVDSWIAQAKHFGIRSIICFLTDEELDVYYGHSRIALLERYSFAGFQVARTPIEDHLNAAANAAALILVAQALDQLPAPWLIHCSAGVDRTGMAVQYALKHLGWVG